MQIAILEPDGSSGLAHFAFELAQALASEGESVRLITSQFFELDTLPRQFTLEATMRLWRRSDSVEKHLRRSALHTLWRWSRRSIRGVVLTLEWYKVTRGLMRSRPDVVICSQVLFPHLGVFLWMMRRSGLRLMQICHEYDFQEREGARFGFRQHRYFSQFVYDQFETIFFLAESARHGFLKRFDFPPEHTVRIRHGGQSSFPPSIGGDAVRAKIGALPGESILLFFGGLRPSKGIDDLIRAFASSRCLHNARLVIAGQPTNYIDMRGAHDLIEELGIVERVIMLTRYVAMQETADLFDIANCVVLPYRSASQSGVLHLAYQFGRPVVATAVGGLSEDVVPGKTGLLVPANDLNQLASALDWICDNPKAAADMGRYAAHLNKSEFAWAQTAKVILNMAGRPTGPHKIDATKAPTAH